MVYQDFFSFLILLAIAIVVTAAKVVISKQKPAPFDLAVDLVIAYLGAWVGSPVFGSWFSGIGYQQVAIIPALLGGVAALVMRSVYLRERA